MFGRGSVALRCFALCVLLLALARSVPAQTGSAGPPEVGRYAVAIQVPPACILAHLVPGDLPSRLWAIVPYSL